MTLRDQARFDLAVRLRQEGAPIGEVFSFISGLYFRGKVVYSENIRVSAAGSTGRSGDHSGSGTGSFASADDHAAICARAPKFRSIWRSRAFVQPFERDALESGGTGGTGLRHHLAGKRGYREICRSAAGHFRRSAVVPGGVRRTRRHEPRRFDVALRTGWSRVERILPSVGADGADRDRRN